MVEDALGVKCDQQNLGSRLGLISEICSFQDVVMLMIGAGSVTFVTSAAHTLLYTDTC